MHHMAHILEIYYYWYQMQHIPNFYGSLSGLDRSTNVYKHTFLMNYTTTVSQIWKCGPKNSPGGYWYPQEMSFSTCKFIDFYIAHIQLKAYQN